MAQSDKRGRSRSRTGIAGLDDILGGGLAPDRMYLVDGDPGAGKTTLALQYLLEGKRAGESGLYVTLSETKEELTAVADSHGWTLDGIEIVELVANEDDLATDTQLTMYHPSEVELSETTKAVLDAVRRINASRVVFDSLSELRLLAGNPLRYRRQILALKQFFGGRNCTVLLLDDMTASLHDIHAQTIAHGVIRLEQHNPAYGSEHRRLSVVKYRGVGFRGGYHDYVIRRGGLKVYPRLIASEHRPAHIEERIGSGLTQLDTLLGGGLERGTSTLVIGAPGSGKSTLATQFVIAAARRGQRAAMFIFDESVYTLLSRSASLGLDLRGAIADDLVIVQQVDPAELSPGEFAHSIRTMVEERQVAVVVIDSLNGYLNAMPDERYLIIQLHELLSYLNQYSVATMLIGAHQGMIGSQMKAPVDASYLADAVILMRYFEHQGELRQAISVIKKRGGDHERSIREFRMHEGRIMVGEPLRQFRGVLSGVPEKRAG